MLKFLNYFFLLFFLCYCVIADDNLKVDKFLKGVNVADICGDGDNIWVATNGSGIYKYSKKHKKWTNYSTSRENLKQDFFYCIAANKKYVWAGSTDGLFILDKRRNRWTKRKFGKGGQLGNWIRSIAYDEYSNVVWIGRFRYLSKFDIKKRRFTDFDLTVNSNDKTNTIKTIKVDGDSLVWFGTEGGLHKYTKDKSLSDSGAVRFYDNSLNYFTGGGDIISVADIFIQDEYLWIGLDEFITMQKPNYNLGGLYRFDRKNEWLRFDTKSGFTGNGIYSLERTGNYVWTSIYQFSKEVKEPYGRGVALINILTSKVRMIYDEEIPKEIFKIFFDGENIWLGTQTGIIRIKLSNELAEIQKGN